MNGFLVWLGWKRVGDCRTSSRYFTNKNRYFVVSLHSHSFGQYCAFGMMNERYSNS